MFTNNCCGLNKRVASDAPWFSDWRDYFITTGIVLAIISVISFPYCLSGNDLKSNRIKNILFPSAVVTLVIGVVCMIIGTCPGGRFPEGIF